MEPTTPSQEVPQAPTPAPVDPTNHKSTLLPLVLGGIALLVVAVVPTIYLKSFVNKPAPTTSATPSPASNQTSLTTSEISESQVAPIVLDIDQKLLDQLKAGGSSYADQKGIYTILYPSEYKQDSQNNGQYTRIFKNGPTQKGQTEMYDGVIISLESISLGEETLDSLVTKRITAETESGTSTVEQSKEKILFNTYPGFTYTTQGLGTFKHIAIQKDANSPFAIDITMLVADPTNAGFQKEVDTTLSTLQLLK